MMLISSYLQCFLNAGSQCIGRCATTNCQTYQHTLNIFLNITFKKYVIICGNMLYLLDQTASIHTLGSGAMSSKLSDVQPWPEIAQTCIKFVEQVRDVDAGLPNSPKLEESDASNHLNIPQCYSMLCFLSSSSTEGILLFD